MDHIKNIIRNLRFDKSKKNICLVLGQTDTGKTTFITKLINLLVHHEPIALVDADIGQSHVGPPTTIAWTHISEPVHDLSNCPIRTLHFVGDLSPVGNMLPFTTGLVRCVENAQSNARIVIVDTPGFIIPPPALALWWNIHQILFPSTIVLIQKQQELQTLKSGISRYVSKIFEIDSSSSVTLKSLQARQEFRMQSFARYFKNAHNYEFYISSLSIQSTQISLSLRNSLVGLRNRFARDIAVGVITGIFKNGQKITVRCPRINPDQVKGIVFGKATLDMDVLPSF